MRIFSSELTHPNVETQEPPMGFDGNWLIVEHLQGPIGSAAQWFIERLGKLGCAVLLYSSYGFEHERASLAESGFSKLHILRSRCPWDDPPACLHDFFAYVAALPSANDIDWRKLRDGPSCVPSEFDVRGKVGPGVAVYSYSLRFEKLWQLEPMDGQPVVVIWDVKHPKSLPWLDAAAFLTPLDWALAQMLRYPQSLRRVFVLGYESDESLHAVRVAQLIPNVRLLNQLPLEAELLRQPEDPGRLLDLLRSSWREKLSSPEDAQGRHAIANLTGPKLLLASMGRPPDLDALDRLLQVLGLTPGAVQDAGERPWFRITAPVENLALVDDMAHLGWTEVLRQALGRDISEFRDVVEFQLNHLEEIQRRRAILFLDLRLFGVHPRAEGTAKEKNFIRTLAQKAAAFPELRQDLALVQAYLDSSSPEGSEAHSAAITLFPRLIALEAATLPIVLFSSTAQKRIFDRLRPYPNIVCDFDKPRFFGFSTEGVAIETRRRFERAMERADALAWGRDACLGLKTETTEPAPRDTGLVEIYIDESGTPDRGTFSIGGVAFMFKDCGEADRLQKGCWDAKPPAVWGYDIQNRPPKVLPADLLPKSDGISANHIARVSNLLQGVEVRAFALVEPNIIPTGTGSIEDAAELRYREMLAEALEAVLFDITRPVEIRVYIATRVFEVKSGAQQKTYEKRFGIGGFIGHDKKTKAQKYLCFAFAPQEALPLLQEVLARRPISPRPVPDEAKATQLSYTDVPKKPHYPKQLHYLADWIAGWSVAGHTAIPPEARVWFERGFLQTRDEAFRHWLWAARSESLNSGAATPEDAILHRATALYHAAKASQSENLPGPYAYSRWIRPSASRWADEVRRQPKVFAILCDRLNADRKAKQSVAAGT